MKVLASVICLTFLGLSNARVTGPLYVSNGTVEEPHSSPWHALLTLGHSIIFWPCGGMLISQNYVLTAARCFNYLNLMETFGILIYLGAYDFRVNDTSVVTFQTNTKSVTYHEGYNATTHEHDIALIKLPSPVQFNDMIQPAKLLSEDSVQLGQVGHISGWIYPYRDYVDDNQYPHGGNVTVVDNSICQKQYPSHVIDDNIFCASGTVAMCYGDEGAALPIDGKIAGMGYGTVEVQDWSEECPIVPNTYVYIPKYLDWIKANSDYTE